MDRAPKSATQQRVMRSLLHLSLLTFVAFVWFTGQGCAAHKYKDNPHLTPLMNAAHHDDLARIHVLLANGADVEARTADGETALYEAIERPNPMVDNLPTVDAVLKAGADPSEREEFNNSALFTSLTCDYCNQAVTVRLLEAGAVVPHDCGEGDSLVSLAAQIGSVDVTRALVDRGAPVNCLYLGASALYWAVVNGQTDLVALLLKSGADPTIQVNGKSLEESVPCPNCDSGSGARFVATRELLEEALRGHNIRK